jgi:hypothetical protein
MSLSAKTFNLLADTLAPRVAEAIISSDEFIEFMHTMVPSLIDTECGEMDEDLHFELALAVMERLSLVAR